MVQAPFDFRNVLLQQVLALNQRTIVQRLSVEVENVKDHKALHHLSRENPKKNLRHAMRNKPSHALAAHDSVAPVPPDSPTEGCCSVMPLRCPSRPKALMSMLSPLEMNSLRTVS